METASDRKALRRLVKLDPYIKRVVEDQLKRIGPKQIEVNMNGVTKVMEGKLTHDLFETVLKSVVCGPVLLVGPAGAGKTTIAAQVSEALGIKFYFTGAITSEYKLMGFIDANGRIVSTAFREAYTKGGLFLFDEMDASLPQALLAFNNALANNSCDFPDGNFERHKDFYVMGAANTYGHGADRVYVGRNQLDAASLDRFIMIPMGYDEKMENQLSTNTDWIENVQLVREAVKQLKLRYIVSPRATLYGTALLNQGVRFDDVEQMVIFKGMPPEDVKMTRAKMKEIATKGMEGKPASVAA